MGVLSLGLALLVAGQAPPAEATDEDIVITGERIQSTIHGRIEEPYPEVERVPTGSRVPRKVRGRPFRAIASDSGMPGMMNGAGATEISNYEMMGWSRIRNARECVADHEQVEEYIVCGLIKVEKALVAGNPNLAAALLAPLRRTIGLTGWERYYLGHFAYRTADSLNDDAGRESALTLMIGSGRMEENDRVGAMRMLASIALRRGDDAQAIARLETLAQEAPQDARSLANLAALYDRAGRHDQARARIAQAVSIVQQAGQTPPAEWKEYLSQPR